MDPASRLWVFYPTTIPLPMTYADVLAEIAAGRITPTTLVRVDGQVNQIPAAALGVTFPATPVTPASPPVVITPAPAPIPTPAPTPVPSPAAPDPAWMATALTSLNKMYGILQLKGKVFGSFLAMEGILLGVADKSVDPGVQAHALTLAASVACFFLVAQGLKDGMTRIALAIAVRGTTATASDDVAMIDKDT